MKRLLAIVLAAGMMLSLLAGCAQNANSTNGGETGEDTGDKEWKIGLVAAGTFGDNGLNDALKKAAETFTENTGIPVTCVEVNEFNDHEIHARNFGNEGYDMVIMGGTVSCSISYWIFLNRTMPWSPPHGRFWKPQNFPT